MSQSASRRRIAAFYLLTVALSLAAALALTELVLRNMSFSTAATDMGGGFQQRWLTAHWGPVNEFGFRDLPLQGRTDAAGPRLYFLGDSFTAGSGVDFTDSFYFLLSWRTALPYAAFNLGRPGASTRDEFATLQRFDQLTGGSARVVVHQYYPNDIDDYVTKPPWTPPPWLVTAARHLETAQFLLLYDLTRNWGEAYKAAIKAAYARPDLMRRHLADLARLHDYVRARGGHVAFLVFPALSPDSLMAESAPLVDTLRSFFADTCRPGDVFIDATVSAATLAQDKRTVSFLDPHPSKALHVLVARQVQQALQLGPRGEPSHWLYERCADLRAGSHMTAAASPGPGGAP